MRLSLISLFGSAISFSSGLSIAPPTSLLTNVTADLTVASAHSANRGRLTCSGNQYGYDPEPNSCFQALNKMPKSSVMKTYGLRHQRELYDVSLPQRYLSDDGLCAIDVKSKRSMIGVLGDKTNDLAIWRIAGIVLNSCVVNEKVGGFTTNFSKSSSGHHDAVVQSPQSGRQILSLP